LSVKGNGLWKSNSQIEISLSTIDKNKRISPEKSVDLTLLLRGEMDEKDKL